MPPGHQFARYIGIDYSGAATPERGLPGIRVYESLRGAEPVERRPHRDPRRNWSRISLLDWLGKQLTASPGPVLCGLDHAFSFPLAWFEEHARPLNWEAFLDDFVQGWPTHQRGVSVEALRRSPCERRRPGSARWRRQTDLCFGAKSVFHFDVPGSVAKSTHAGLPMLQCLRNRLGKAVHFWPFDGWVPRKGVSVIAEIYPSLWSHRYPRANRTPDQHDAYASAKALSGFDASGTLQSAFNPDLNSEARNAAEIEGWILGPMILRGKIIG